MVTTFSAILAAAEQRQWSQPPDLYAVIIWLVAVSLGAWLCITGRSAESIHRLWSGTWLLPGALSDLATLKRVYRWIGTFLLVLVFAIGAAILCARFYWHTEPPVQAMQLTATRFAVYADRGLPSFCVRADRGLAAAADLLAR
jgi:hypothetical protein